MIVFFVKCLAFLKTYPIFAVEKKKRMTVFSVANHGMVPFLMVTDEENAEAGVRRRGRFDDSQGILWDCYTRCSGVPYCTTGMHLTPQPSCALSENALIKSML